MMAQLDVVVGEALGSGARGVCGLELCVRALLKPLPLIDLVLDYLVRGVHGR